MNEADWENFVADFSEDADWAETTARFINDANRLFARKSEIKNFFKVRFTDDEKDRHFGHFTNRTWRKFLLSVYYADLLCYPREEDQVDFARLCYILSCAPQGFTVWWAEFAEGEKFPVGYTGWYCVAETVFQQVAALQEREDKSIHHRFFLPAQKKTDFLYLFNYSIARELKSTRFSSELIKHFAAEINSMDAQGLFCATVSGDGSRVAEKFSMKKVGAIWSEAGASSHQYLFVSALTQINTDEMKRLGDLEILRRSPNLPISQSQCLTICHSERQFAKNLALTNQDSSAKSRLRNLS